VADLFRSATDTDRINALGIAPIRAELTAIGNAENWEDLMRLAAGLHLRHGNPFFNVAFFADQKKRAIYMDFYLSQGGMSLPSKEYYFSEKFSAQRWEFVGHVAKMFELAGGRRAPTPSPTLKPYSHSNVPSRKTPSSRSTSATDSPITTSPRSGRRSPRIPGFRFRS